MRQKNNMFIAAGSAAYTKHRVIMPVMVGCLIWVSMAVDADQEHANIRR